MADNQVNEIVIRAQAEANSLVINSMTDYANAANWLKNVKAYMKSVENFFASTKEKTYAAWKDVCAKEKSTLAPLQAAEVEVKNRMVTWKREQDRLAELARKQEEERIRKEKEEALARAVELESQGKQEEAEETFAFAEIMEDAPAPVAASVKVEGTHTRKSLDFEIVDDAKVPAYLNGIRIREINAVAIRNLLKLGVTDIPGIRVFEKETLVIR